MAACKHWSRLNYLDGRRMPLCTLTDDYLLMGRLVENKNVDSHTLEVVYLLYTSSPCFLISFLRALSRSVVCTVSMSRLTRPFDENSLVTNEVPRQSLGMNELGRRKVN